MLERQLLTVPAPDICRMAMQNCSRSEIGRKYLLLCFAPFRFGRNRLLDVPAAPGATKLSDDQSPSVDVHRRARDMVECRRRGAVQRCEVRRLACCDAL